MGRTGSNASDRGVKPREVEIEVEIEVARSALAGRRDADPSRLSLHGAFLPKPR
jgi:hypothetical protein